MSVIAKPAVRDPFANTVAPGPSDLFNEPTYMDSGFPAPGGVPVRPSLGFFNWLFNFLTAAVRYFMQRGISSWDAAEDGYTAGSRVRAPDGNVYTLSGAATTGLAPQSDQGNWVPEGRLKQLDDSRGGGSTSFDGTSNPTTWNDLLTHNGSPISALDVLPTFAAASGYSVTIGAGSGNVFTSVGLGAGESTYREVSWASQNLTHATPDATLPRYDAVTVMPAAFGSPSVLAVVAGTPAALPLAPAIPAGAAVLFYVYVGAAAADATHFRACRGLGRRVGYPWAGMSAVVAGCELSWDYSVDPTTTPADIWVGAADQTGTNATINRLLIDGEMVEWIGYLSNTTNGVVSDSTADPFGTASSSSFDRPYYIYAVGGRHNPMPANTGTGVLNPVTICESTVAPNPKIGKPTANLTVNGVTVTPDGAVYIGLGFVFAGSTRRRGCLMDGEMTYSLNPLQILQHNFTTAGYEDVGTFAGGSQPAISTKVDISLTGVPPSGASAFMNLVLEDVPRPTSPFPSFGNGIGVLALELLATLGHGTINFTARHGSELWGISTPSSGTNYGTLIVSAMGFNHRVRRLVAGY